MKRYSGKSLDEVLNNISKEQNVKVEEINYTILEEKKGILGIGTHVEIEAYTINDVKEFIFDYLGNFFMELNQEVSIEIICKEDIIKVILDAENNAIIIGKNGLTLQSINTVLKGALNGYFKTRINVIVDVNNYKEERYNKIKKLAFRVAKNVRKTKVDATLDPMPNDERKVIHQCLQDMENIKTESINEGRHRQVVIKYVSNENSHE